MDDDAALVSALRAGDEGAFARLVDAYSATLLSLARMYVPSRAVAEDVVQETWLGVLRGIDRFEGRSSLKTWVFRILVNTAKTRGAQERRTIPFSSAVSASEAAEGPAIEPERFMGPDGRYPGGWAIAPTEWQQPDEALLAGERRELILRAIEGLPPAQREVVTLRDIRGWESVEVCDALEISPENQRVLLHRGRSKIRKAVEAHLGATEPNPHAA